MPGQRNDRWKSNFRYWLLILVLLLLCGCGGRGCGKRAGEYNKKADNPLSEAVYEKVGGEDVYYAGTYYEDDVMIYSYTLRKYDKEVIRNFAETVQQVLCTEEKKVEVLLRTVIPGGRETIFVLTNHFFPAGSEADYIGLRCAFVNYPDVNANEVLADPLTYTVLPKNLCYIGMNEKFKSKAEELQIDWKEFYPELETFQWR